MIDQAITLLPINSTPGEQALAATSTRYDALNAPVREVWSPWTCPPKFLPFLAHAFSVDLWDNEWTDARKRRAIARAVELHRTKGTRSAAEGYLEFVDSTVLEVISPPERIFSGPSLTKAEREAWLSSLPQVRTWRIREFGERLHRMFSGGIRARLFVEGGYFTQPSTAIDRLKRRARWVVDGVETDTRVEEIDDYFRLHVRARNHKQVFATQPIGKTFWQRSDAYKRLVTIRPAEFGTGWRSSIRPRLTPVTAEPERTKVQGVAGKAVYSGRSMHGFYFVPSSAPLRIFWRFAVHDGRNVVKRPACQFMAVGRYGWPAHSASLRLSIPGKLSKHKAGEGIFIPGTTFWIPHDPTRLTDARRALTASQRASDKLLIRYKKRPAITAGQPFLAGIETFIVGRPGATR